MKSRYSIEFQDIQHFKKRVHDKTKEYACFSYLDSCTIGSALSEDKYELLVGLGARKVCESSHKSISKLRTFFKELDAWCFGGVSYDLRSELFSELEEKKLNIPVPHIFLFVPKTVIYILKSDPSKAIIETTEDNFKLEEPLEDKEGNIGLKPIFKSAFTKEKYIQTVNEIRQHIEEGTFYEMNLCQEFVAKDIDCNPYLLSRKLLENSPAPFSAFCKWKNVFLLSASPERFLLKKGTELISQPIKGTQKRSKNQKEESLLKEALLENEKELAENVMIVDLVRNDFGKISKTGSISVPELFGLYSFEHVHQLISTVKGDLEEGNGFTECLEAAFPMGSMTGAPKLEVMKHIDSLESSGRGLYSGTVGYIEPNGDFDFNVVIRSLLYDVHSMTMSYHVGGAITYDSIPEKEYEECLLKAMGIQSLF